MEENKREMTTEELRKKMEEMQKSYESMKKIVCEREAEEAKQKQLELKNKRKSRKEEVDKAYETYRNLVYEFTKDYGWYTYIKNNQHISETTEAEWEDFWNQFRR